MVIKNVCIRRNLSEAERNKLKTLKKRGQIKEWQIIRGRLRKVFGMSNERLSEDMVHKVQNVRLNRKDVL